METLRESVMTINRGMIVHRVDTNIKANKSHSKKLRHKFPKSFQAYRRATRNEEEPLKLGDIQIIPITYHLWLCNIADREDGVVDYNAVKKAYKELKEWNDKDYNLPVFLNYLEDEVGYDQEKYLSIVSDIIEGLYVCDDRVEDIDMTNYFFS